MKRILLALAIGALALPLAQQARSADISIDFFYDNLSGGNWMEVDDYGYCWQPDITVSDPSWRPYTDGYWAYTDVGWTWISYEDFGWATYHYGRWIKLADYGWIWVPGSDLDWGPAWVSWRVGDDYVGWAPLPPRGPGIVYEGGLISGHVDIEFDIGPACYNFVDVRYIGEPVLRNRIIDVRQNVTFITKTVNVTNITYKNKTVYNYGPDIHFVEQHSSRPIQRLHIERRQNADIRAAVKNGGLTKVQGPNLVVAAPLQVQKPATLRTPPKLKTTIAKPKVERGWTEVGNEQAQAELKQKIKSQNLKKIPTPTPGGGAAAGEHPSPSQPINSPGATKSKQTTLGATPSPGEESGRTNLNSSKSNAYKNAGPTSTESPRSKIREKNLKPLAPPEPVNPPGATTAPAEHSKRRIEGTNGPPRARAHENRIRTEKGSPTPSPR
jgi:Family of unknown function (DUF6600)